MGERMVIALQYVVDADGAAFVAGNRESHRVRPRAFRKPPAHAACITQIAGCVAPGPTGFLGRARRRVADALPPVSQRQHGAPRARLHRVKVRTRHFAGYSNTSMPSTRLDTLKSMVDQNPTDSFARYGLAMEYRNTGQLEAAIAEFRALMAANPGYAPAYFHGGQALERIGRIAEARQVYLQGIEVTTRSGDQHARSELQGVLDLLD